MRLESGDLDTGPASTRTLGLTILARGVHARGCLVPMPTVSLEVTHDPIVV